MAKNPLQAQLLKAGLVKAQDVKTVNTKARKQGDDGEEARRRAADAQAQKIARDRELAGRENAARHERELAAQVRQIILHARQSREGGEVAYRFTDGTSVKKLNVTASQSDALAYGQLAIVRLDEYYELVPLRAAEKIRERAASVVVVLHVPGNDAPAVDDPYADYQIPDDLMW